MQVVAQLAQSTAGLVLSHVLLEEVREGLGKMAWCCAQQQCRHFSIIPYPRAGGSSYLIYTIPHPPTSSPPELLSKPHSLPLLSMGEGIC